MPSFLQVTRPGPPKKEQVVRPPSQSHQSTLQRLASVMRKHAARASSAAMSRCARDPLRGREAARGVSAWETCATPYAGTMRTWKGARSSVRAHGYRTRSAVHAAEPTRERRTLGKGRLTMRRAPPVSVLRLGHTPSTAPEAARRWKGPPAHAGRATFSARKRGPRMCVGARLSSQSCGARLASRKPFGKRCSCCTISRPTHDRFTLSHAPTTQR